MANVDQQIIRHNQTTLSVLKRGDLVEFDRGFYSHWGVYLGDGKIVHLAGQGNDGLNAQINPRYIASASGTRFSKARVVIDKFWDVAGSSKAHKNNSEDGKKKPLDPEEIVKNALSKVGDVGYNLLFKNCEHFAKWCRYGVEISDQTLKHNETTLSELERGDLVQFDRGFYSHWAVYLGNGEIVHVAGQGNDGINAQINPRYIASASGTRFDKAKVVTGQFWDVVGSSKAYKNNPEDYKKKPLHPDEIERNAQSKIGEVGYNLIFQNCEHFATWCRYDEAKSGQIETALTWGALGVGALGVGALAIGAAWAFGKTGSKKEDDERKMKRKVQKPRHS